MRHLPRPILALSTFGLAVLILSGCQASVHRLARRQAARPSVEQLLRPTVVRVDKSAQGHWRLVVDGQVMPVQGVFYTPAAVGQDLAYEATWHDWTYTDLDRNTYADAPYDAWVDKDRDNLQDWREEPVGDFFLMKQMGVNTIQWYHNDSAEGAVPNKDVLRDLYFSYDIRVAVGDLLGADNNSYGYSWEPGTDYRIAIQREKILASVRAMVETHRDEPYVLMWLLGNGNNRLSSKTNAAQYPEEYATLLNEAARLIHTLDSNHPVALVNDDIGLLRFYAELCPDIDVLGIRLYRGVNGPGEVWSAVKQLWDKPILVTGYGGAEAPGFDQEDQARFHQQYWLAMRENSAGFDGEGNAIGAIVDEWVDQWWRAGNPYQQAAPGSFTQKDGQIIAWSSEWAGICSQGAGRHSPYLRQLRKVYNVYRELWRSHVRQD